MNLRTLLPALLATTGIAAQAMPPGHGARIGGAGRMYSPVAKRAGT